MNTVRNLLVSSCALAVLTFLPPSAGAQEQRMVEDLRGKWKFQVGDDQKWADPTFDDSKWDEINAPSPWEDEGYPGYDGYGWYRKRFVAQQDWWGKVLHIHMGTIDDADELYVNGHFIGFGGQFPPHYISEYGWSREYLLPPWCLKYGAVNVIAVRVFDGGISGGITRGRLGIYQTVDPLLADQPLDGTWKIMTGDNDAWKQASFNEAAWHDIKVPLYWETQGMKDYDGFAWYRFRFRPAPELDGKTLILLLGKIDDLDETFLNGERIGRTGTMRSRADDIPTSDEYTRLRAYTIPRGLLKFGEDNVIAVRVFDKWLHGGIYDGPVGLITRDSYREWTHHHREKHNPWDFLKEMFDLH